MVNYYTVFIVIERVTQNLRCIHVLVTKREKRMFCILTALRQDMCMTNTEPLNVLG